MLVDVQAAARAGVLALAVSSALASGESRRVEYAGLPSALHAWLRQHDVTAENFATWVRSIDRRSEARRTAGEHEHLVYFVLQSKSFTNLRPIEPALSAQSFIAGLRPEDKTRLLDDETYAPPIARLPSDARDRFRAFVNVQGKTGDERVARFAREVHSAAGGEASAFLYRQYVQAMRFLYRKEFTEKRNDAAAVEKLYHDRGLSLDSRFEANFAVDIALKVLKSLAPDEPLNRVLIVGPGLDLAPRTDLVDLFQPHSYQPFAIADSLLQAGLADPAALQLHAVDINEGVVSYFERVSRGQITRLPVLAGLADRPDRPLSEDYRRYFREFGTRIGRVSRDADLPPAYRDRFYTSVALNESLARRITAERLNIITERDSSAPAFDLAVVTNVFPYFSDPELALALANVASMLHPGGYLIHNDARAELPDLAARVGLPTLQVRTVLFAPGVYDVVWLHRKH